MLIIWAPFPAVRCIFFGPVSPPPFGRRRSAPKKGCRFHPGRTGFAVLAQPQSQPQPHPSSKKSYFCNMVSHFKNFIRQKSRDDSGFSAMGSERFIRKDGSTNVQMKGGNILTRTSWYHTMLGLSSVRFIVYLVLGYIAINILFAFIYQLIGIEHLSGIDSSTPLNELVDVFFFSSQTFTTVGYGRIAPVGFLASLVSTFEAFLGLLAFAIATGLFYGRFSRPQAFIKFSENALIAPFQEGTALMFRLAPYKNNSLTNAEVILTVAIETDQENKFYTLETQLKKISNLALNWTVVHVINKDSPFYGLTDQDFRTTDIEVIVQLSAFDDVFSNTVVQRTSYISPEIVYGAKFLPMFTIAKDGSTTVMDIDKLNAFVRTELPKIEDDESAPVP